MIRATQIRNVGGPTPIQIRGRIASPNTVVSPVTQIPAAVLQSYFFIVTSDGDQLVHSARLGRDLVVQTLGGFVHVVLPSTDVYFRGANPEGIVITRIPDAFPALQQEAEARELATSGKLLYRELRLVSGQPVRLRGTVVPTASATQYRSVPDADVVITDETERASLSADVVELA